MAWGPTPTALVGEPPLLKFQLYPLALILVEFNASKVTDWPAQIRVELLVMIGFGPKKVPEVVPVPKLSVKPADVLKLLTKIA